MRGSRKFCQRGSNSVNVFFLFFFFFLFIYIYIYIFFFLVYDGREDPNATISSFCLLDLILYVPSTIFQSNRDGSFWVELVLS